MRVDLFYDLLRFSLRSIDLFRNEHISPYPSTQTSPIDIPLLGFKNLPVANTESVYLIHVMIQKSLYNIAWNLPFVGLDHCMVEHTKGCRTFIFESQGYWLAWVLDVLVYRRRTWCFAFRTSHEVGHELVFKQAGLVPLQTPKGKHNMERLGQSFPTKHFENMTLQVQTIDGNL